MKLSMDATRAFLREHLSPEHIKRRKAKKFGYEVEAKQQVELKVPREEGAKTHNKPKLSSRHAKKTKPSKWASLKLSYHKRQAQKTLKKMLRDWVSGKPDRATQSFITFYHHIHKYSVLEKRGPIAADENASSVGKVTKSLIDSLPSTEQVTIKQALQPGAEIYRGLCAIAYLQDGIDKEKFKLGNDLSDNAKFCISITQYVYQELLRALFPPDEAREIEEAIMAETHPRRAEEEGEISILVGSEPPTQENLDQDGLPPLKYRQTTGFSEQDWRDIDIANSVLKHVK